MTTGDLKNLTGIFFALALILCLVSCTRERSAPVEGGSSADFSLTDTKGKKVRLSDFKGRVVLLEFWATWCPPCRESVPEMNALYEKYKDRGFVVLGISVDRGGDALSSVNSFVKDQTVLYPVLLDDGKVNASYGVTSIPAMFIIDKEGKVVKKLVGFMPGLSETLSQEIETLL